MKNSISLLMFVLLGVLGYLPSTAQQYFNKRYTLHSGSSIISGALEYKGRFYTTAISLDSSNYDIVSGGFFNRWGIRFTSYDANGNILKDTIYQRKDRKFIDTWSNNLSVLPDGTFLLAANAADTGIMFGQYISYTCLLQFDSNGNLLKYKEFNRPYCLTSDATYHILFDFKPDAYGNWMMLSSLVCNGKVVLNLRKLDNAFNEVWVKNFTTSSHHNIPKHLLIEDDGYVMTGGINNGNIKLHADYYTSVLIKCDTSGNKLWDWQNSFDTTKLQYIINDIIRSKDGGYVYCGTGEGRPTYFDGKTDWSGIRTKGWVEKLDASRNSVWKTTIGPVKGSLEATQQTVIKELPNGDLMVAGTLGVLYDKTDEAKGWIRACLTRISGVDGSIIWQRLYKSPDNNDTMYLSIYDMRPTADGGYILAGEAKNVIDRGNGPIQRGWLIKVDSNGCEWAGSPCNPTHITPLQSSLGAGFRVYPNPSNGIITVKSPNAVIPTKEGTIHAKIYDLLGRLILQKELSFSNNEAQINLNAASATYILELKDKEGKVQRERIVIE
jgi:hypothetical protein